ncbi:hypothetical protein BZL30_2156 [Mycobacterium kansasii]|uniref:Uncharacterized protein n=1 Tax=Mycobacterium kansasii TaxID=1768 RepID=A0A1V3XHT2_MYCKA|nr:hypothetical protein BZL30_2156 [Mycobacterium kansasii]
MVGLTRFVVIVTNGTSRCSRCQRQDRWQVPSDCLTEA